MRGVDECEKLCEKSCQKICVIQIIFVSLYRKNKREAVARCSLPQRVSNTIKNTTNYGKK